MTVDADSVSKILAELPAQFRGPGGAVAVVKDGQLLGKKVWGYADLGKRIAMTADTIMPICSISKQMVCGLLTDLENNPTSEMAAKGDSSAKQLSDQLGQVLRPELVKDTGLTVKHLCNNQSGIRDYWALTVLWGAKPEGHFSIADHGPLMLERLRSFHFEPGTSYSYANTNFYILGRMIERATGRPLKELLDERIFKPAGMKTARLCAHSAEHPPPCVGYEGDEINGYWPAENCIEWAGDAGIVASLDDMVAYEQYIDSNRAESGHWYPANATKQSFKDGSPSVYGFGLGIGRVGEVQVQGHGGALRGYRLFRVYAPEQRISVVVLLNQEKGPIKEVSDKILKGLLNIPEEQPAVIEPSQEWFGCYLDPETQMAITVEKSTTVAGEILLKYQRDVDKLRLVEDKRARSKAMDVTLDGDVLTVRIPDENRKIQANRVPKSTPNTTGLLDIAGDYHCEEIDSTFHCEGKDGLLYGFFEGFLGTGPAHFIKYAADDVLLLVCPRSMDASPPGDWTLVVHRNENKKVTGLTIGCWLARKLEFVKTR